VTLGQYVRFTSAALFSMFLGSHVVHTYYRPMKDLSKYIEVELEKLPEDVREKVKTELH
jgi:hypothetical protein